MNACFTLRRGLSSSLWLCAAMLVAPVALAANPAAAPSATPVADAAATPGAQAQPRRGAPACTTLRGDARAHCLNEAGSRPASPRPSARGEDAQQLARNALLRCEPLRGPDRQDCVARIQGQGTTTGSVAAGGIYRELVTIEASEAPPLQQAAPSASAPAAR